MDKNRLKQGLVSSAPYVAFSLGQVPFLFSESGWVNGVFLLTSAYFGYKGFKKGVRNYDYMQLIETELYKEYVELYHSFVKDIADMYKELNIDTGLGSALAYKICQENGIFSATGDDKYTLYEDDKDYFIQSLGGRVTTGRHCCRHNASLMSDVINARGGLSPKISVYVGSESKKQLKIIPNHLICGVLHNGKRIAVDPSAKLFLMYSDGLCYYKGEKALARDVLENGFGAKYTVVSAGYDNGALYNDFYEQFMKFPAIVDSDELFEDYVETLAMVNSHLSDFRDFHEEEKPKILELSRMAEIVAPHGKKIEKDN